MQVYRNTSPKRFGYARLARMRMIWAGPLFILIRPSGILDRLARFT